MAPERTPKQSKPRRGKAAGKAAGKPAAKARPGEQLDQAILRSRPELSALEVAAETGITIDETRRLWRALGFPEFVGEKAYTAADVEAVVSGTPIDLTRVLTVSKPLIRARYELREVEPGVLAEALRRALEGA